MCAQTAFLMYATSGHQRVRAPFSSQQLDHCTSDFKFKSHILEIKVQIRLLHSTWSSKFKFVGSYFESHALRMCAFQCSDTSWVECDWVNVVCVCVHLEKRQFFVQWVIRLMARVNGADASGTVGNVIVMRNAIKITRY